LFRSKIEAENQVQIPLSQLDSLVSSTSKQYSSYKAVPRSDRRYYRKRAKENAVNTLFSRVRGLQVLVLFGGPEIEELPLVDRVEGREIPLSFPVNSLKQAHIGRGRKGYQSSSATKGL